MARSDEPKKGLVPRIGVIRLFDEAAGTSADRGWLRTPESGIKREEPKESPAASREPEPPTRT